MQDSLDTTPVMNQAKSLAALLRTASRGSQIMENINQQAKSACKPLQVRLADLLTGIERVELVSANHVEAGQILAEAGEDAVAVRALGGDDLLIGLFCFQALDLSALVNSMFGSVYEDRLPAPVATTHKSVARELSGCLMSELVQAMTVPGTAALVRMYKVEQAVDLLGVLPPVEGVVIRLTLKGEQQSAVLTTFVPGELCAGPRDEDANGLDPASSIALLREIKQTRVPLSVVLEERQLSLQDLAQLRKGTVVNLNLCLGQQVDVDAGGARLLGGCLDQSNEFFRIVVKEFLYKDEP